MCSWMVTAVVNHYNSQNQPVYAFAMDLSKAFDMVECTELIGQLRARKGDPIFLRLLISMYKTQMCDVKWGSEYSSARIYTYFHKGKILI